jgi:hypothetical protein
MKNHFSKFAVNEFSQIVSTGPSSYVDPYTDSIIEVIITAVKEMYPSIRYNSLTGNIEDNNGIITKRELGRLYKSIKKSCQSEVRFNQANFEQAIQISDCFRYCPFDHFLEKNQDKFTSGDNIWKLVDSLSLKYSNDKVVAAIEISCWLEAMVASIFSPYVNEYMLILIGKKELRLERFFRDLLPPELSNLYIGSGAHVGSADLCEKVLHTTDFDILLRKDDEEIINHTQFLSSEYFSYLSANNEFQIGRKRLVSLSGIATQKIDIDIPETEMDILDVSTVNWELYYSIDKTSLMMEACNLFFNPEAEE